MEKEELIKLANNEEFQELVKKTKIGNRFQFNDRYFQIVRYPKKRPTMCECCIFYNLDMGLCNSIPCVKNGIDINIKEISETEYKNM